MSGPRTRPQAEIPATYGGDGYLTRDSDHAGDLEDGEIWRGYRVASSVAPLQAVLLALPGEELDLDGSPNDHLMLARPDLALLQEQMHAIAHFFWSQGVTVHVAQPRQPPPPNYIFQADLFFMTPEGAVVGRPAPAQRAGEARHMAAALATLGVPILATMRGNATFEGADALWLTDDLVLIGVDRRTNAEGAATLSALLAEMGVASRIISVGTARQHLMGLVVMVDTDLAIVDGTRAPDELKHLLAEHGITAIELPPSDEIELGRANNVVTLGPRRLVMPAGCPNTAGQFREAGIEVHELEVSEYGKAGGALGCLTGVLARG